MAKKNGAPSRAELERLAATLKPGQRIAVGPHAGVTMTVDGQGRMRFQWRSRIGGRGTRMASGTRDSYDAAVAARELFEKRKRETPLERQERGRKMRIEAFVREIWWPHVETLADLTQLEYRSIWEREIEPFFKGMTLGQLAAYSDWQAWDTWLRQQHTYDGVLAKSAVEKAYKILGRILRFAVDEEILAYDPLAAWQNKRRRRDRAARKSAAKSQSTRPILRSEVPTPLQVEQARFHIPGRQALTRQRRRALITVLGWGGLRPGEALYLRWRHVLTRSGPLGYIEVRGALKDVAGYLVEGETKTHEIRDAMSFPFIDAELWELYEACAAPSLDEIIFLGEHGGPLRWDNFRNLPWYKALHLAGIAIEPRAKVAGAFHPYMLRHHCASVLMHANTPEGHRYSHPRIADSLGHTLPVLLGTYAKVVEDDLLHAGGRTVEEIALAARRAVWGPLPGDCDYDDRWLTTGEVAKLTGLTVSQVGDRCRRGTLPSRWIGNEYLISGWELRSSGLSQAPS